MTAMLDDWDVAVDTERLNVEIDALESDVLRLTGEACEREELIDVLKTELAAAEDSLRLATAEREGVATEFALAEERLGVHERIFEQLEDMLEQTHASAWHTGAAWLCPQGACGAFNEVLRVTR